VDAVPEFVVEVTCDAIEALQLESGARIYLVFKASSVSTLTG
jgi:molybdopterin-binding protein